MNQIALPLRARNSDPITSHEAAKHANTSKAEAERQQIFSVIDCECYLGFGGLTAKEIAEETGLDYIEVQRRISEVQGIYRTGEKRGGCMVWSVCQ